MKYIGGSIWRTIVSLDFILCTIFDLYKGLNLPKFKPYSAPLSWEIIFLVVSRTPPCPCQGWFKTWIGGSIWRTIVSLDFILGTLFYLYKGLNLTKYELCSPPQSWEINFLVTRPPPLWENPQKIGKKAVTFWFTSTFFYFPVFLRVFSGTTQGKIVKHRWSLWSFWDIKWFWGHFLAFLGVFWGT